MLDASMCIDLAVNQIHPFLLMEVLVGLDEYCLQKQPQGMTSMKQKSMRPGPSEITYKTMNFLIMDRPTDNTIPALLEELKKRNVKDVVRVCEATYSTELLEKEGIRYWAFKNHLEKYPIHFDWPFDDGFPPPAKIVDDWFELLRNRFKDDPNSCVAVHCVAGLGRAPVLVALALIELGMKYEDAVELIRQKRRGAINAKQLQYLEKYRPKSRLKMRNGHKQCLIQ
ncbi:protein tyrosine phosphatase type IVA 3 [Caerostris extrusa]|uniref:Protein tyrosine phosphatase type IVA 3 n=1 Tax=Caerostris extrusa TaxID=172846 RepID=A0AAV4N2E2_CAEEX|nr:protein tyrosine phosphatase type IVA 3 [Caerostris extrusa]